ncbi:hypothetical protein CA13_01480 [Planctomycetes bacterium CA13]|uniref:Uncharacterized protein n=1 Tax=Novipirellula herctigrandis TaxID=2527986 RepID=A0A5C5YVA8_9BACT|nr:hypothetical protein CA13_01480 [Planctomycetes bacterium CA13]
MLDPSIFLHCDGGVQGIEAWQNDDGVGRHRGRSTDHRIQRVDRGGVYANGKWERTCNSDVLTVNDTALTVDVEFPEGA